MDGAAWDDPEDFPLVPLPDFDFFLGTSNSADIGSLYRTFSLRAASLSRTCWCEYKMSGRGPGCDKIEYQGKHSERPNDTLPTTLLRYERPFTPVSVTNASPRENYITTIYSCYKAYL